MISLIEKSVVSAAKSEIHNESTILVTFTKNQTLPLILLLSIWLFENVEESIVSSLKYDRDLLWP